MAIFLEFLSNSGGKIICRDPFFPIPAQGFLLANASEMLKLHRSDSSPNQWCCQFKLIKYN